MLLTKLHIPSPGKNLVQRDNLSSKLNQGLKSKLMLISAPAGFGKTTLISEWLNKERLPAAWYSLNKGDNDPVDFLSYIILAIKGIKKEFGQSALELLKSPNTPNSESIINLLINEIIEIEKDFLLVLDDFHLIDNSKIIQLVTYLLDNIPNNTHVAILTRSDPALPIARLRSQNQLVEFRSSDLSFSVTEISTLFNKKLKIKLSIENSYKLENKTEGWLAGLHLTALSIPDPNNITDFIDALKGDNRFIMDYLIEEVLKIQTDDVKEFLLQTSILEQFSAPLCNTVLNRIDSQEVLENLDRDGMFIIPLDTDRHWYRYHHLFADLLKQRLLLRDKNLIEDLHTKASNWYEENEMYDLAIEHTLVIKDYVKSIQVLGEIVEKMWKNGLHSAILSYGDLIPDELIKRNAEFCLYYSWLLIPAGQIQRAEPFLVCAERETKKVINDENSSREAVQNNKKLLGKISVAFAYLNSHEAKSEEIFNFCKTAMGYLLEDDPLWLSWAWFSYGTAYYSMGDLHGSNEAFKKAMNYAKKSGNIYQIASITVRMAENEQQLGHFKLSHKICSELIEFMNDRGYVQIAEVEWSFAGLYSMMAAIELCWGQAEKADEKIKTAYNLCKSGNDVFSTSYVLLVFTGILFMREDIIDAEKKINELDALIKENKVVSYFEFYFISMKLFMYIELKQFNKAENFIAEHGLRIDGIKTHLNETAYSMYARLLLIQNKLDDAEIILSELYVLANEGKRIERVVELKILYAIMHEKRIDHENAIKHLIEAMELAADEFLLIYFVYNSEHIDDLLKEIYRIQVKDKTRVPKEFSDRLKLAIEKKEERRKNKAESDLSTRELDVLNLIAKNHTNQEVADLLFISIHTVKTHVKNIHMKMEVESRSGAVSKAKKLGIILDPY